jgi:HAD superfamily hydrolase (TIGR01509 family)
MIRLIIFDFDGLILDTETPDYVSWQEIYSEYGVELTLDAWAHCVGAKAGVFDPIAHLASLTGVLPDRESTETRRRSRFYQLVEEEPLRPGVREYLDSAPRLGVLLAVASSATRDWVEGHLAKFGILDRFQCIKCVEDVERAKPDPDLFLAVCRELGVRPHEAVVLEDSPNGLLAANRAGIFAVAVPNSVTASLHLGHADLTVPSLEDVPLDQLIARVNETVRQT